MTATIKRPAIELASFVAIMKRAGL